MKGRRTTLSQVARRAGVGIATVDRVLNERGNVSPDLAERVLAAARDLDLPRRLPDPYRRTVRIELLALRIDTPYYHKMHDAFGAFSALLGHDIIINRKYYETDEIDRVHEYLDAMNCDLVMLHAVENEKTVAAINRLVAGGTPVVTFIADIPASDRTAYVGPDNREAGRIAGYLMSRMVPGEAELAVICRGIEYSACADRTSGFAEVVARHRAGRRPVAVTVPASDAVDERLVADLLDRHGDVRGVYIACGSVDGFGRKMQERIRDSGVTVFCHELTEASRDMLRRNVIDLVFDQNADVQVKNVIEFAVGSVRNPGSAAVPLGRHAISIHTPESTLQREWETRGI